MVLLRWPQVPKDWSREHGFKSWLERKPETSQYLKTNKCYLKTNALTSPRRLWHWSGTRNWKTDKPRILWSMNLHCHTSENVKTRKEEAWWDTILEGAHDRTFFSGLEGAHDRFRSEKVLQFLNAQSFAPERIPYLSHVLLNRHLKVVSQTVEVQLGYSSTKAWHKVSHPL